MKKGGVRLITKQDKEDFIERISVSAVEIWNESRICLPSVCIAVAADYSKWGTSENYLSRGQLYPHQRSKVFDTDRLAIAEFNYYLSTARADGQNYLNWENLIGAQYYILAVQHLQYAEYPYIRNDEYDRKIVEIIEKMKLDRYD